MLSIKTNEKALYVYKRLLNYVRAYWGVLIAGILASIFAPLIDAGLMALLRPLINHGFTSEVTPFVAWLPVAVLSIFFIRSAAYFTSDYCLARVGRCTVRDFRRHIFKHLLKLPARYYDTESSGRILALLTYNVEQLSLASTEAVSSLFREGVKTVGLIAVMFYNSWQLSLIFLVAAPIMALIVKAASRRMRLLSTSVQKSVAEVSHVTEESVEAYRVIQMFDGQQYEEEKFFHATKVNFQKELKLAATNSLSTAMVQMVAALPLALIIALATGSPLAMTAGGFASMIGAMLMLLPSINRLTRVNGIVQKGIASAQSIFGLLAYEPENYEGGKPLKRAEGHIVFDHVHFSYASTPNPILSDIDFTIEPGMTIALVGPSGAGKSTLINLLPRFYKVNSGELRIDGVPINDYNLKDLRQQFSYVSQNVQLFSDTVAHNVAYGSLTQATPAAIQEALELAQASEFVAGLPEKENTLIGENGLLLSGGQRQRLAIARALLKKAPILILDEATSSLDTESEYEIQQGLDQLMSDCTTIVIAHRLSTVKKADQILVLDRGSIKERGTHEELIQKRGAYAKLYQHHFMTGDQDDNFGAL